MASWKRKALAALDESIRKWEALSSEYVTAVLDDEPECALCESFWHGDKKGCSDCPVQLATGKALCRGTPYRQWRIAAYGQGVEEDMTSSAVTRHAKRAFKFLQSLDMMCPEAIRHAKRELRFLKKLRADVERGLVKPLSQHKKKS